MSPARESPSRPRHPRPGSVVLGCGGSGGGAGSGRRGTRISMFGDERCTGCTLARLKEDRPARTRLYSRKQTDTNTQSTRYGRDGHKKTCRLIRFGDYFVIPRWQRVELCHWKIMVGARGRDGGACLGGDRIAHAHTYMHVISSNIFRRGDWRFFHLCSIAFLLLF